MSRLKVPPQINQFTYTIDKNQCTIVPVSNHLLAQTLFKLLKKYAPETKKEKKTRLLALAKAKADCMLYLFPIYPCRSCWYLKKSWKTRWIKETNGPQIRTEPYYYFGRKSEGKIGSDRSWCQPNWTSNLATNSLQKNGCSLLLC